MKKRINSEALMQEFEEGSAFFRKPTSSAASAQSTPEKSVPALTLVSPPLPSSEDSSFSDTFGDTMVPRYHDTEPDTVIPRHHDTTPEAPPSGITPPPSDPALERVRRALRQQGKEAATHRFTVDEKRMLKKIEHEYLLKGIRTSENEITRIAINYLGEDYRKNKDTSILAKILDLLNR